MAHWASIVVAPLVFLANLSLAYALVPLACQTQRAAPLHVTSAVALVLALASLALAWREKRRAGADVYDAPLPRRETGVALADARAPKDDVGRDRFLSTIGICVSLLFALAILALWSTQWMLSPCFA